MKYLKLFDQSSEYNSFKESNDFVLPNVSFVKGDNTVLYKTFLRPEVIKYHFEVPMQHGMPEEGTTLWQPMIPGNYGILNGDFSEIFNKMFAFLINFGEAVKNDDGTVVYYYLTTADFPEYLKLTINDDIITDMEWSPSYGHESIHCLTNGPLSHMTGGGPDLEIGPTHIEYFRG